MLVYNYPMEMEDIKSQILEDVDPELIKIRKRDTRLGYIIGSVQYLVIVALIFIFFYVVMGVSTVSGMSMYPTLRDGQHVIYRRHISEYHVGDIIALDRPDGQQFVKRIVAVAGDTVNIQNGEVYVNGELQKLVGPVGDTEIKNEDISNPYIVKDGEVFVLGDNRENSKDSRSFGAIKLEDVKGKILWYFGSF